MIRTGYRLIGLAGVLAFLATPVLAQNLAPAASKAKKETPKAPAGAPFAGFGSNSKEPIKIDAAKLEVFDKENKAIFTGDVVAIQGQTTMRCDVMAVLYNQNKEGGKAGAARTPAPTPAGAGQSSIRQIDCDGQVSLLSGTQSATANKLVYEADKDIVTLTGKVVIADCDNVQRGERVVYDVKTGKATVDAGASGRVQGVFTPGGDDKKKAASEAKDCSPAAPAAKTPAQKEASGQPAAAAPSKAKQAPLSLTAPARP